jgi:hypothetical protein
MQVISSDSISWKSLTNESGNGRLGVYMGMPGKFHQGPQAFLVQVLDPGGSIQPHFHDVDQFQVIVQGDGVIGKKPLRPITAQYADAYTPYGPIVSRDDGISFFTLRQSASAGHFHMPGSRDKMPGRAGRNIAALFNTGEIPAQDQIRLDLHKAEDGLCMQGFRLAANASVTPATSTGGCQFFLICSGSLVHEGQLLPNQSLIYVEIGEAPPRLQAGPDGAEVMLLQFPKPSDRPGSNPEVLAQRSPNYTAPHTLIID